MTSRPSLKPIHLLGITLLAVCVVGYALRSPLYAYGISDHNEQLIIVKRFLDSSYLANDYVLNQKAALGSPRFVYAFVVSLFARVLGLELAYFVLYVGAVGLTLWAIYTITTTLFGDPFVGVAVAGLFLLPVTGPITLGGSNLLYPYLIPTQVSAALSLTGFVLLLRKHSLAGFALLGVTAVLHASIGLWMGGVALIAATTHNYVETTTSPVSPARNQRLLTAVPIRGLALYAVIAGIGLAPTIVQNLTTATGANTIWIMTEFRHPHHYLPSTWNTRTILEYVVLVVLGFGALARFGVNDRKMFTSRRTAAFGTAVAVVPLVTMFVGGYLLTEVVLIGPVVKLQPFHIAFVPKIIFFGCIVTAFVEAIRSVRVRPLSPNVVAGVVLILLATSVVGAHAVTADSDLQRQTIETPSYSDDQQAAYDWLRSETPENATVIAPPSLRSVRLGADRAIVADYKVFVFTPQGIVGWKTRLNRLCGTNLTSFGQCEYDSLTSKEVVALSEDYDACYFMSRSDRYEFSAGYQNDEYTIYRISRSAGC